MMNASDFNELSDAEKGHFYKCQQCGEMVDMRQLDEVQLVANRKAIRKYAKKKNK